MNQISKTFDIKNKNIVITGSSGTLGSQYSNFLSAAGANLILIDLEKKSNEKLEKQIKKNIVQIVNHTLLTFQIKMRLKKSQKK